MRLLTRALLEHYMCSVATLIPCLAGGEPGCSTGVGGSREDGHGACVKMTRTHRDVHARKGLTKFPR